MDIKFAWFLKPLGQKFHTFFFKRKEMLVYKQFQNEATWEDIKKILILQKLEHQLVNVSLFFVVVVWGLYKN